MSNVSPGWYKDPAEPTTQRYWDGEGWVGSSLPIDATPPDGPIMAGAESAGAVSRIATPSDVAGQPATSHQPQDQSGWAGPTFPAGSQPDVAPPSGVREPTGAWPPYSGAFPPGARPPAYLPPGGQPPSNWPAGVPFPGAPYALRPVPRPHGLALAPLGLRFLARIIDIAAVLILNVLLNGWLVYQWTQETSTYWKTLWQAAQDQQKPTAVMSSRGTTLLLVIMLLAVAIWLAYEVPFIAGYGQTLGKRIMGIRVVPLEGLHRIGYPRAVRRWMSLGLPMVFSVLTPAFIPITFFFQLMASLSPVINRPLHLALHDRAAATIVVEAGPAPETPDESPQPDGGMK